MQGRKHVINFILRIDSHSQSYPTVPVAKEV